MDLYSQTTPSKDVGYYWWVKISNAPIIIERVPIEVILSFPIAAEGELRLFHYRVIDDVVMRPTTYVRAQFPDFREVILKTDKDEALFPSLPENKCLGKFHVEHWTSQLRRSLLNMQPLIMQRFPDKPAGALGAQYQELFNMLTPDVLKPFYEALNPDYFQWLRT